MTDPAVSPPVPPSPRKRTRLTPAVRRQQILDVALDAFSTLGFAGTSMDRIAAGVGLSKAGLYAHFASKDDIFEALLTEHMLSPPLDVAWTGDGNRPLEEAVDDFLDRLYASVADPRARGTFRLLVAESGRAPEFMRRWHDAVFAPHGMARRRVMQQALDAGLVPRNPLTENAALVTAPALVALMWQLLLGDEMAERQIEEIRASHRALLLILLDRERGNLA